MNHFWQSSLLLINLIAFALYGIDKAKARMHAWRIPERLLLTCGLLAPVGSGLACLSFTTRSASPTSILRSSPALSSGPRFTTYF